MSVSVTIAQSGHRFGAENDRDILSCGLAAGLMLPYNCRSGFCRTCKGRVVSGVVTYEGRVASHYLPEAERERGFALLCQARADSDLVVEVDEIIGVENVSPREMPARVVAMTRLAPDIMRVVLRVPMNENVRYFAGQHLAVLLEEGIRREYSIANVCAPEGMKELELHVRHTPGGLFTDRLFNSLAVKTIVRIEVPLGTFFVRPDPAKRVVLLATGTGFAPIKAMIEHMIATGAIDRHFFDLYWGARTLPELYFAAEATAWASAHPNLSFHPVLSRMPASGWNGRRGHVQDALLADLPDLADCDVYACGSPAMIDAARARFDAMGDAAPARFFADAFLTEADRAALSVS